MISSDADVLETVYSDVDIENLQFGDAELDCVITDHVWLRTDRTACPIHAAVL